MGAMLLTVHVVLCLILMGVVLLQQGKGASLGASFGGGSQTIFGGRGPATFFQKLTTVVALCFLLTSLGLAKIAKVRQGGSVLDSVPAPVTESAPVPTAPQEGAAPGSAGGSVPVAPESAPTH